MKRRVFMICLAIGVTAIAVGVIASARLGWTERPLNDTGVRKPRQPAEIPSNSTAAAIQLEEEPERIADPWASDDPSDTSEKQEWHVIGRLRFEPDVDNDLLSLARVLDSIWAAPVQAGEEPDEDRSVRFDRPESLATPNVADVRSYAIPEDDAAAFQSATQIAVTITLELCSAESLRVERLATPRIAGRTIDLGEIGFSLTDGLGDSDWLIVGCLLDSQGHPLRNTSHMRVELASDDNTDADIVTDPRGRFAEPISLHRLLRDLPSGTTERQSDYLQSLDWVLVADDRWTPYLHALPCPGIDRKTRIMNFGSVTLDAASLEISCYVPEGVDAAPSVQDEVDVEIEAIDDSMTLEVQIGFPARILLAADTYWVSVEFRESMEAATRNLIASGNRVYCAHRQQVVLQAGASERINVPLVPPHDVAVTVERGRDTGAGELEIEYCPAKLGWCPTIVVPIQDAPMIVRLLPGERAIARARLAGFAEVEADVPQESNELVLRPVGSSELGCIVIEFCPDPPWVLPVDVLLNGPERRNVQFREERFGTETWMVPRGHYRLVCRAPAWKAPPDGIVHDPYEFDLGVGETRYFRFEKYIEQTATSQRVRCGGDNLEGSVPGEWTSNPGEVRPSVWIGDNLLCVHDGSVIRKWKQITTEQGVIAEIALPKRIEVRFGDGLSHAGKKPFNPKVTVSAEFESGSVRCRCESKDGVASLWAPAGQATIHVWEYHLYSGSDPEFDWKTRVDVREGQVVVVAVPDNLGRADFGTAALDRPRHNDAVVPAWGLWKEGGEFLHWIERRFEFLAPGSYYAKPAFGPQTGQEVRFSVQANGNVGIPLHELSPVPASGILRLPRQDWMGDGCSVTVDCRPAAWTEQMLRWAPTYARERVRLSPDYLEVTGLPPGVELTFNLRYESDDEDATCEFTASATDGAPKVLDSIAWERD